ncbi:MAG: 1-acyl-sn-glycerol-3-phosphate acyltransferase [Bacteroidales bacterium]
MAHTAEKEIQLIDVENVLKSRNPRLYALLPRFIPRYLKRIVHQDELNDFLRRRGHLSGKEFIAAALEDLKIEYEVVGRDNIPREGRYIFASNHPLGGLDGLVFIHEIGKYHEKVLFIVNDLLMNISNLEPVFIPVNKHGRQSLEYARKIEKAYSSDAQILYFPAGLCSRKRKGIIRDLEWKKNFIVKARQYQRDIVPMHFSGRNSNFFYRLANLRVILGIRSNIEMVYLPDEMFKQVEKNKKITLTIGQPIPFDTFDKRHSPAEWAELLKYHVYNLEQSPNMLFPHLK